MNWLRIREVHANGPFRLRLTLTNGATIDRDVADLLTGPIFEAVRGDPQIFGQATIEAGTVCWPDGADLCPDMLIWGGAPPEAPASPPADPRPWAMKSSHR